MTDLRIVDAPVLLQESITDDVKMPTGGLGNYAIRLGDLVWYVVAKEQLASKSYVDNSSQNVQNNLDTHIADKANPHQVTKEQVGLGNVDNTADIDKPVSNAVSSAIITATTDMATKAYVNQKDNLKADKATTLSGYGITDAYTKDESNSALALKASVDYVDGRSGDLETLNTINKTDLVKAINEVISNINGLESINELIAIKNPYNGQRAYVKSYYTGLNIGGGDFIYDSTKVNINNNGTIINGWVRQIDYFVTPCMFGAYADDTTNDAPYIQKASDYAANNNKELHFEGRKYVVRKDTFETGVVQYILTVYGNNIWVGQNATVRIDHSNLTSTEQRFTSLIKPSRKSSDATAYKKLIDTIDIRGFTFDGGFDYIAYTDHSNKFDIKKAFFMYGFEVRLSKFIVKNNTFTRFANQNVILMYYSNQFKPYGISESMVVTDNTFYDNGLTIDMSTLYLMSKNTYVMRNKFEQPQGREDYVQCAMELHGSNSLVDGNTFTNTKSWVNAAVNYTEPTVGNLIVVNNMGESYESLVRVWSGESTDESDLENIIVSNNTVRFITSTNITTENYVRAVLNTGNFNKSVRNLNVNNNTVTTADLTDSKQLYFLNLTVQLDWYSDIQSITVNGNTGTNMTGFVVIGRYANQAVDNCYYRNIQVNNNNVYSDKSAKLRGIYINQHEDSTAIVDSLMVANNTLLGNVEYFIKATGYVFNANITNNRYPDTLSSENAISFAKKESCRFALSQQRQVKELIETQKTAKVYSVAAEYLRFTLNVSTATTVADNVIKFDLGVMYAGVRIKKALVKFTSGVSQVYDSNEVVNVVVISVDSDYTNVTESSNIINKSQPTVELKSINNAKWELTKNIFVSLQVSSTYKDHIDAIKASGGDFIVELEIERI